MADGAPPEETAPKQRLPPQGREAAHRTWPGLLAWRRWPWLVAAGKRLWVWLVAAARRLDTAAGEGPLRPPPEDPVERRELAGPITVPARGYVFGFTVRAAFTWTAQGLRPELLAWYAHYFMPQAIQRLTRIAGDLARTVPPHRAGDLEEALQQALGRQQPWSFERGGVPVTCRPEAWVRLDERVRHALQPYWERMIALDCRHEEFLRRARYAEQLNRRWSAILDDLAGTGLPEELSEELARVRERMLAEQRAAARWSGELLRQRRHQQDLFEPFTEIDVAPKTAPRQPPATERPPGGATQPAGPEAGPPPTATG